MNLDASIVIVSFNTRELLRECLRSVYRQEGASIEVIVVDNNSQDGSAAMVRRDFPEAVLLESPVNLGFAAANNLGFARALGRYVILLNSDAFLEESVLRNAVGRMDVQRSIGLAGGLLKGRDGSWQPSARLFPSVPNDILSFTGLSSRFRRSRFFGRFDRTWADPRLPADTDWVPGAFSIFRRELLNTVGGFDERFFLYYEEVDFCRRIKAAGYRIAYWPELVVTHVGGESSRTLTGLSLASSGAQLTLWRMRSQLLYYRKHHRWGARFTILAESCWHGMRLLRNRLRTGQAAARKAAESKTLIQLFQCAWNETQGGRVCPAKPW